METLNKNNDPNFVSDFLKYMQFLKLYSDVGINGERYTEDRELDWPLENGITSKDYLSNAKLRLDEFTSCFKGINELVLSVCGNIYPLYKDKISGNNNQIEEKKSSEVSNLNPENGFQQNQQKVEDVNYKEIENMRNVYGQSTSTYRVNWFYKLPKDQQNKNFFNELRRKDKTYSEVQVIMSVIS